MYKFKLLYLLLIPFFIILKLKEIKLKRRIVRYKKVIYYKSSKYDTLKQIDIANKLINIFSEYVKDEEFKSYMINENNILIEFGV